jgi:hypothetical protein
LIELFLDQNFWHQKINPTILIELFLDQNFWHQKINPIFLIGQINPTNLVGFKKNSQKFPKKETLPFW